MSVDDIAAQGAEPLFFLDYVSVGELVPETIDEIVAGVAEGCRQSGCALIGGEMSEHPDAMEPGEFDLVGFAVGVVERAEVLPRGVRRRRPIIGIGSPGLRCNGYSLRPRALLDRGGRVARDAGVARTPTTRSARSSSGPSVIYAPAMAEMRRHAEVHAFAHVTGGGIPGNLVRVLPEHIVAVITRGHVGGAPDLRARSGPRARWPTTRWSRSSTSGWGCSRSSRPVRCSARSTSVRAAGHEAWVVGEVRDGHGPPGVTIETLTSWPSRRASGSRSTPGARTPGTTMNREWSRHGSHSHTGR